MVTSFQPPTDRNIYKKEEPVQDRRNTQKKQKKKGKGKANNADLSFRRSIDPYKPSNQKREEARSGQITTATVASFQPPTRQYRENKEDALSSTLKPPTKNSRRRRSQWSSLWSTITPTEAKKKVTEKADDADLFFAWPVDPNPPSDRNDEEKRQKQITTPMVTSFWPPTRQYFKKL